MKIILLTFLFFSCAPKMVIRYGIDGKIVYRTPPGHTTAKDVLSTGDTLYTDTKAGVMMRLTKTGDTVILYRKQ